MFPTSCRISFGCSVDYTTCARIHSWTDDLDRVSLDSDAAVAAMFANDMGANAAPMYDKMVKKLLSEAFSVQGELDLIGELISVKLPIGDETTIRDDVTQYCTQVMIIAKKLLSARMGLEVRGACNEPL